MKTLKWHAGNLKRKFKDKKLYIFLFQEFDLGFCFYFYAIACWTLDWISEVLLSEQTQRTTVKKIICCLICLRNPDRCKSSEVKPSPCEVH